MPPLTFFYDFDILLSIPHVVKFARSAPMCNGSSQTSTGLIIYQKASRCTTHLPLVSTLSRGLAAYRLLPTVFPSALRLVCL